MSFINWTSVLGFRTLISTKFTIILLLLFASTLRNLARYLLQTHRSAFAATIQSLDTTTTKYSFSFSNIIPLSLFSKNQNWAPNRGMILEGIIRPSNSPFSASMSLARKKDGTWRFCVDYWVLNTVTVKDNFPITTIDELFNEVISAQVFSKLDLWARYHWVLIYPPDIEKMAF